MFDDPLGLGLRQDELAAGHTALRAVVVYAALLVMVRFGGKRIVGHNSAFDLVLAIVLGSVAARSIYTDKFFEPLAASTALVGMHWLTSWMAARSKGFRRLTDGSSATLLEDGEPVPGELRRNHVPVDELDMAAREEGLEDRREAKRIVLECDGRFSVLPKDRSS